MNVRKVASTLPHLNRRNFLSTLSLGAASMAFLGQQTVLAATQVPERSLNLYNTHTGESFSNPYWCKGVYIDEACTQMNYVLRDHRNNQVIDIDKRLMDVLYILTQGLEHKGPVNVISAYRSPETNKMLRKKGRRVAKHSMHIEGKAIDIRLPHIDSKIIAKAALALKQGGVGYYPKSQFVHIDTGDVRHWGI